MGHHVLETSEHASRSLLRVPADGQHSFQESEWRLWRISSTSSTGISVRCCILELNSRRSATEMSWSNVAHNIQIRMRPAGDIALQRVNAEQYRAVRCSCGQVKAREFVEIHWRQSYERYPFCDLRSHYIVIEKLHEHTRRLSK